MHVQDELRFSMTIGHRVGDDPIQSAGNQPYQNLALRCGELSGILDNTIERSIGYLREIMRLPIVPPGVNNGSKAFCH